VIAQMWESFTWAMSTFVAQVWEIVVDAWHDHPMFVVGVVITITFTLLVIFRPAR
jgi:hypothetical protein